MASVPVDWFLIVIAVIVPIVLVFMNLVIMRYFLSPEVKGHYIGRAFVVRASSSCFLRRKLLASLLDRSSLTRDIARGQIVCLLTTELTVLLLPLDVVRRRLGHRRWW